jgi:hypothetical protein
VWGKPTIQDRQKVERCHTDIPTARAPAPRVPLAAPQRGRRPIPQPAFRLFLLSRPSAALTPLLSWPINLARVVSPPDPGWERAPPPLFAQP